MEVTHKQENAPFSSGHPQEIIPQIAIIGSNTLMSLGLKSIIEKMMPGISVCLFSNMNEMEEMKDTQFIHFFISTEVLMDNSAYFLKRKHQTIVLVHGNECIHFPGNLHTLNVCLPENALLKSILKLAEASHGKRHRKIAEQVQTKRSTLTKRELQVLELIVRGNINKEIASQLNVTLATIISHRKNLIAKLGIKSVSGLTIYAVTHGLVRAEEI